MDLVKVQPSHVGYLTRYRCVCTHCEGAKASGSWPYEMGRQFLVVEGFEESPCEPVALIHR